MIRILSRKTKNNPVLIGEPGVGKSHTALWWAANNDNAIHVQVTHNMTPRWLLMEIVKELGEYPAARSSDLFNQIVKSLSNQRQYTKLPPL